MRISDWSSDVCSSDLVEGGERFGRYSIICLPPRRVFAVHGPVLTVSEYGDVVETREVADPLAEVERLRAMHPVAQVDGLPGFTGALVGWFRSEEHTSELQSLMRTSYAVFCLKNK